MGLEEELGKESVGGTKQSRADGAGLKPQGASKAPLPFFLNKIKLSQVKKKNFTFLSQLTVT